MFPEVFGNANIIIRTSQLHLQYLPIYAWNDLWLCKVAQNNVYGKGPRSCLALEGVCSVGLLLVYNLSTTDECKKGMTHVNTQGYKVTYDLRDETGVMIEISITH